MLEQIIILIFLVLALGITLELYILKAKKEMLYRRDERWKLIQIKANQVANISNWFIVLLVVVGTLVPLVSHEEIVFTLQRVTIFLEIFIGVHNFLELLAIKYYDKRL